jgi:LmbE family N-acetylglucosaminyl deacetylase
MGAVSNRAIVGAGTAEPVWLKWLLRQSFRSLSVQALCANKSRLVVVAPHPDDEVLACGALLAECAQLNFPVKVIAVTDGEASHLMANESARQQLSQQRMLEQSAGLLDLGLDPACIVRLKIPDGRVASHFSQLSKSLARLLRQDDMVITTWRLDGHPDHEATAQAVISTGCDVLQAPVWMWHWAQPGDVRVTWNQLVSIQSSSHAMRAKISALAKHQSQLTHRPGQSAPVLASDILQRAERSLEYFFTA